MQTLFDPVIAEITSLVSQQVREAKDKKKEDIDVIIPILPLSTYTKFHAI